MASYYQDGKSWTVSYRLKGLAREYVYGLKTERLAKAAAAEKSKLEQLVKAGLHTPQPHAAKVDAAAGKDVEVHIKAFERSIVDRGKNARHAQQTAGHVRRLLKSAGISRLPDLAAEPIQAAAKRLIDDAGLAPRTANAAVKAARQFSTWCYTTHRTTADVLHRKLQTYNEAVDQRRRRRALAVEELTRLVDVVHADTNRRRGCGIPGRDRAMLYQVAVGTGFRQRACLSLSKSSFHVGPKLDAPFVRLGAAFNKNGKDRDQRIRRDLADLLHGWLKTRPDDGPVWRPSKHAHLELMLRRDLELARAAWLKEAEGDAKELERRARSSFLCYQDHAGRFADFHSLRHTGISLVVRRGNLRAAQVWADHSTPLLTARYAHVDVVDEERALEGLPAAQDPDKSPARQPADRPEGSGDVRKNSENRRIG